MKNLKQIIENKIKEKKYTKELIYSNLGMTKAGFDSALKNESLKLKHFSKLADFLTIEPNDFFEWNQTNDLNIVSEPEYFIPYGKKNDTKNDTMTEVQYLRSQNDKLLRILENFSLKTDTKNIN